MTIITTREETDLEHLRRRLQQLESVEQEFITLKKLLAHAAQNKHLGKYGSNIVLHIHPATGHILDVNPHEIEFLGYTQEDLLTITIDELEVPGSQEDTNVYTVYIESSIQIQAYHCVYRHREGYNLPVIVHKWPMKENGTNLLCYSIEEQSLRAQLWRELSRREDTDYEFREKLKALNEITIELGQLDSFDDVCRQAVASGIQKLGFDRISLWFLDDSKTLMTGTYGVDEEGRIRDERGQSWSFASSYIGDFANGRLDPIITHDSAPLYNERSELVGYGWHLSTPILDRGEFIGYIGADNFIHKNPIKNYQAELLRLYGSTIGHLTAHQAKQETIRKLSSAIQHSSSKIVVLDQHQIIEFANDAFCQFSDYSLSEILRQDLAILFPENYQIIRQIILSGQAWQGELVNQKKNGELYETLVSISPVRSGAGDTIESYVMVQEDITLLKQVRQKELALQLEHERAHLLEMFVTDIGHEFKTPLAVISTSNFILGITQDEIKRKTHGKRIEAQVGVLNQMLNEIIEIVQLTSGIELETEPVWLDSLVQSVINSVMTSAAEKHLNWQVTLESHLMLQVDPEKAARVIKEFLKNAIQYTPEHGTITVCLNLYENQVGIVIQDTGIGIPAPEIEKIFNRFYRVDKARSNRSTGLGLAIAKLLIEAHQGQITVESILEQGSRFEIFLPLERTYLSS